MQTLDGRVALVTGGGSGIGLGVATALAREGCRVVIAGRNADKLERAAADATEAAAATAAGSAAAGEVLPCPCDVADRDAVARLVEWTEAQAGPPVIVVNSAGINVAKRTMAELSAADFDRMVAVNLTGLFNVLQAVLPGMRARGDGLIVSIASIAGKRALPLAGPGYCASKFGAVGLAATAALEEREHGIRISSIHPGEVDTPILDQRPVPVSAERRAEMVHPEDIAACVVLLAKLPEHVIVPELVITPTYQAYA
jgi:NAD(P)-dependent dehydrogenase (short-subunit alcohol dehydrogenase family)